jgi:hypothetical protein
MQIHLYPSGYIAVQVAVSITWSSGSGLGGMNETITQTRPWRRNSTWEWASRVGTGALHNIVERALGAIRLSLFKENEAVPSEVEWYTAVNIPTDAGADQMAGEFQVRSPDLKGLITSIPPAQWRYLLPSRQGLFCAYRPERNPKRAARSFRKFLTLAEYTLLKHKVFGDYSAYLEREIVKLTGYRLSVTRKMTREDVTRFSVYDHTIPQFITLLDAQVRHATLFYRRVYSGLSAGTDLDGRREGLKKQVEVWEEEVGKWESGLATFWRIVVSPIRSLLSAVLP